MTRAGVRHRIKSEAMLRWKTLGPIRGGLGPSALPVCLAPTIGLLRSTISFAALDAAWRTFATASLDRLPASHFSLDVFSAAIASLPPIYFGGCRPGLVAHLSRFSITFS
jgi:hypothetical protein